MGEQPPPNPGPINPAQWAFDQPPCKLIFCARFNFSVTSHLCLSSNCLLNSSFLPIDPLTMLSNFPALCSSKKSPVFLRSSCFRSPLLNLRSLGLLPPSCF